MFPARDGLLVVPAVLPIHVSDDELKMTVADWLTHREIPMSDPSAEPIEVLDGQDPLPLPPFAGAGVTALDPDQDALPQEPGSAIEEVPADDHA